MGLLSAGMQAGCWHIPVWPLSPELGANGSLHLPPHWFPAVKSFSFAETPGISAPNLAFFSPAAEGLIECPI